MAAQIYQTFTLSGNSIFINDKGVPKSYTVGVSATAAVNYGATVTGTLTVNGVDIFTIDPNAAAIIMNSVDVGSRPMPILLSEILERVFLRPDSNIANSSSGGSGVASAVIYDNGQTGSSSALNVAGRLKNQLWVEDFRENSDTDSQVWTKAIAAMQALRIPLNAGQRVYNFTSTVIVAGDYFILKGAGGNDTTSGTVISNSISGFSKIAGTVTADTTIPTTSSPGPMRGCAFYFISLIYYPKIEGVSFNNFRFALAYLTSHNSPSFIDVYFYNCNAAVLAYQGCQNYNYISCNNANCDVIHISSATCFPSGSTYAGLDNYYTDGLMIKNEGGYGSFSGCAINAFFDTWFVASVLRPSVASVSVTGSLLYQDYSAVTYADASIYCTPSGRAIFAPMRNGRIAFGWHFNDLDVRGLMPRGFALINGAISGFVNSGSINLENMFGVGDQTTPFYTVGAIVSGSNTSPNRYVSALSNINPMFAYTQRGYSAGLAENSIFYLDAIENKANNCFPVVGYSNQLTFDSDKMLTQYLYQLENFTIASGAKNIIGKKIYVRFYNQGGTITFSSDFRVIQGYLNYGPDIILEFMWYQETGGANPYATVRIFSVGTTATNSEYNIVTGTTQALVIENSYIANNASQVVFTLPTTSAIGSKMRIQGLGAGGWKIAQNASQNIKRSANTTTTGTGGSITSTNLYDAIELVCIVANTTWAVRNSQGTLTIA